MTFDVSDLGLPHRMRGVVACGRLALAAPTLKPARPASRASTQATPDYESTEYKRSKHDHRSRIPRARRPGLQPHPARRSSRSPTSTRRCRCTSSSPTRATRSCSSRSSAASASAAIRSSACRRRCAFAPAARAVEVIDDGGVRERSKATRSRSSRRTARASTRRRCRACRASAAGSPASSATTSCATSRRGSRTPAKPPTPGLADVPGPPAAAHRGARGGRQPEGQDLAHRLRRSGAARARTRARASGCGSCAASCASR